MTDYMDALGGCAECGEQLWAGTPHSCKGLPQRATLTFENFSEANRERCESPSGFNHKLNEWSTSDWFVAVLGELGEAANIAKKLNRVRDGVKGNKETPEELRNKLRKELGDIFVYLDLLAQANGFMIADAATEVFNEKSAEIGYPKVL
jgi:NTP pyrophosphatase (non-canonical NTP hydrolase)